MQFAKNPILLFQKFIMAHFIIQIFNKNKDCIS